MRKTLLLLVIFCTTLAFSQEDKPIDVPKIAVKVSLGETIKIDGIAFTFKEVLEDSRCPKDVQCIWAGRIKILVMVSENGAEAVENILIFGQTRNGEPNSKILAATEAGEFVGMNVTPYPQSEKVADPSTYTLLISQSKKTN